MATIQPSASPGGMDLRSNSGPLLQEQSRLTHELVPVGLAIVGLDGSWIDANPGLCRILGREREELLMLTVHDVTRTDDLSADLAAAQRLLSGDVNSYRIEKRYVRPNGGEVWAQLEVTLVRDEDGSPLYFVSAVQDLSEQKNAEELLDVTFEASPDLLAILGSDGYFLRVNSLWNRVMGWTHQELTSRPFLEFVHPDDIEATVAVYDDALKLRGVKAFENRYLAKDGSYRWLQWNSQTNADKGWIIANARDVTERKKEELELQRSNADLAGFAAIITHDIKSPLAAITGFAQLASAVLAEREEHSADEHLDAIRRSAVRLTELIDGVLSYSQAVGTAEHAAVDLEDEVDVSNIVEEVKADLDATIAATGAELTVTTFPSVPGNRVQLRQVLQNLVSNALKFGREGVPLTIDISARYAGSEWQVAVADNGIGMTESDSAAAFEVFRQGPGGTARGGVGLGLATCRRLIERRGGRIWFESEVNVGTTVWFSLPGQR